MSDDGLVRLRGRGTAINPPNRFERLTLTPEAGDEPDATGPRTIFYRDSARTIVARNESPDVGFEASINPYRGCEHGCAYCYARPTHEYLGLSAGLDFETRIFVKERAAEMLRVELSSRAWTPTPLSMSGVTDPYQPIERRLELTRRCLDVLAEFRNPVGIVTKNRLVTRDADLLAALAAHRAAAVCISITTLDPDLARSLEPRASTPEMRLAAIGELADAGIRVGVLVAPIIPGLTDHEIPAILAVAATAGATFAGYTIVRLPLAVAPIFEQWLDANAPARKSKVLNRIRSMRGGRLNDPRFGERMRGKGAYADEIRQLFRISRRRSGIAESMPELSTAAFHRPAPHGQLTLFA